MLVEEEQYLQMVISMKQNKELHLKDKIMSPMRSKNETRLSWDCRIQQYSYIQLYIHSDETEHVCLKKQKLCLTVQLYKYLVRVFPNFQVKGINPLCHLRAYFFRYWIHC